MYRLLVIFVLIISLAGCGGAEYKEGGCIQNIKDGFIWRIIKVDGSKCTVQGWFDGKWGLPVTDVCGLFDSRYVKVECPFITQTV